MKQTREGELSWHLGMEGEKLLVSGRWSKKYKDKRTFQNEYSYKKTVRQKDRCRYV